MKLGFRVNRANGAKFAEVYIYGAIGGWYEGIDAKSILNEIKELGDVDSVDLHINSPGGSVSDGIAIFNAFKRLKAEVTVYVDGLAASIASVIAQCGDKRVMAEGALMMIHDPSTFVWGNAADMRKEADVLDVHKETLMTVYLNAGFSDKEELGRLMSAETWMTGEEAVENGLADEVEGELQVAALLTDTLVDRLYGKKPVVDLAGYMKSNNNLDTDGGVPEVEEEAVDFDRGLAEREALERSLAVIETDITTK